MSIRLQTNRVLLILFLVLALGVFAPQAQAQTNEEVRVELNNLSVVLNALQNVIDSLKELNPSSSEVVTEATENISLMLQSVREYMVARVPGVQNCGLGAPLKDGTGAPVHVGTTADNEADNDQKNEGRSDDRTKLTQQICIAEREPQNN